MRRLMASFGRAHAAFPHSAAGSTKPVKAFLTECWTQLAEEAWLDIHLVFACIGLQGQYDHDGLCSGLQGYCLGACSTF